MIKRVVISGCSGGGKSTLLAEFAKRGYATVAEPGRRVIADQRKSGGTALPWVDLEAFAKRALETSLYDIAEYPNPSRWVFFDRGLVDAASALAHSRGGPIEAHLDAQRHYCQKVFLTPPWPEIYAHDTDRQHGLDDAIDEYDVHPNFTALIYPAYLGDSKKDRASLDPLVRINGRTPPTFIAIMHDDSDRALFAALYYAQLQRQGVSGELHIYNRGGHGYGLRTSDDTVSTWPYRLEDWLRANAWIK